MTKPFSIADRMNDIEPFRVMQILAKARQLEANGIDVVHMEIGEPDFVTPAPVLAAAQGALQRGLTHYTPALGLPALREKIALYYQQHFAVKINPDQVVITPGASGALMLALGVLLNPGKKVLVTDPGYPCNRHFIRMFEGLAVALPVDASNDFQPDVELVARNWDDNTVAIILASPANPTGTLIQSDRLEAIVKFVEQKGAILIMDEIYQGLVYDGVSSTIAGRSDHVFIVNSFSKYFCMTGWRLGWLVMPEHYVSYADKLSQNIFLAASTLSQYAALAAFEDETIAMLEQHRREFKARRDYLFPQLQQMGFACETPPQGAFYIYANCEKYSDDSISLCDAILKNAAVAVTPGDDFGRHRANTHIRFAYTTSLQNLQKGVHRLAEYTAGTTPGRHRDE